MKRVKSFIMWAVVFACIIFSAIYSGVGITYAANTTYSTVFEDLNKDGAFDMSEYPEKDKDYSLNVIQIAESSDGELFIYVYQPAAMTKQLIATSLNMSLTMEAADTKLYNLTYLSSWLVFAKYRVDGVKAYQTKTRHYNITSILRAWDSTIDKGTGNDNTISEVAYKVAQEWTATTTTDKSISYAYTTTETVTITRKYCGMIRHSDGVNYNLGMGACDGHFVAFSTDWDIDKLLAAKVSFTEQTYKKTISGTSEGEKIQTEKYILHDQYAQNSPKFFGKARKWQRIQTGKDFAESLASLKDDKFKQELSGYQYVLNFYETEYTAADGIFALGPATITSLIATGLSPFTFIYGTSAVVNSQKASGTLVTDVMILELTFEKDGQTYNLGVVDNKQSGTNTPLNPGWWDLFDGEKGGFNFFEWLAGKLGVPTWAAKLIVSGVIIFIVVVALGILSKFFPIVGQIIMAILKGLWYVIASPGYLIAAIVRAVQKRKAVAPVKAKSLKCKSRNTKPKSKKNSNKRNL